MKICAVLLVLWYCMSIVGFDLHVCNGSGRTFVTTFAEGITCADIHPEHRCGHSCHHESACCHQEPDCCNDRGHESGISVDSEDCCTDSYQVIVLTGCRAQDDSDGSDVMDNVSATASSVHILYAHESSKYRTSSHYKPDSGIPVPCDRCVTYGVWRI